MATMNISLPDTLRDFVEAEVREKGYSTTSEFFRDLLRAHQKHIAQQTIEALLIEGIESGPAIPMTKEDWNEIRNEVRTRLSNQTSKE